MMITHLFKLFLFHCHCLFCNNNISIHTLQECPCLQDIPPEPPPSAAGHVHHLNIHSHPHCHIIIIIIIFFFYHPDLMQTAWPYHNQWLLWVGVFLSRVAHFPVTPTFEERPLKKSITVIHLLMNNSVDILIQFVR